LRKSVARATWPRAKTHQQFSSSSSSSHSQTRFNAACEQLCFDTTLKKNFPFPVPAKFWNRLSYECDLWRKGLARVAGVDEAGCGPLAGPVVAATVVFPLSWLETGLPSKFRGLNDSKQLTEEEREKFFDRIQSHPEIQFAVSIVDVETIDRINIRQAAWQGMNRALEQLQPRADHVLVDGLRIRWLAYPQTALVRGDARSYSIAAASILAKVTRDRIMLDLDKQFPGYGFADHKGYSTRRHFAALEKLGPCPIHRKSFGPMKPQEPDLFENVQPLNR
jgi:ribonuclease HII